MNAAETAVTISELEKKGGDGGFILTDLSFLAPRAVYAIKCLYMGELEEYILGDFGNARGDRTPHGLPRPRERRRGSSGRDVRFAPQVLRRAGDADAVALRRRGRDADLDLRVFLTRPL